MPEPRLEQPQQHRDGVEADEELRNQLGGTATLGGLRRAPPATGSVEFYVELVWDKYEISVDFVTLGRSLESPRVKPLGGAPTDLLREAPEEDPGALLRRSRRGSLL